MCASHVDEFVNLMSDRISSVILKKKRKKKTKGNCYFRLVEFIVWFIVLQGLESIPLYAAIESTTSFIGYLFAHI